MSEEGKAEAGPITFEGANGVHWRLTCENAAYSHGHPGTGSYLVTRENLLAAGFAPASSLAAAESKLTEQIQANEAPMAANRSLAGKLADATSRAETSETLFEKAHLNCSHAEARLLETKQRLAAELAKRVHLENEANALRWDLELVASGSATQQETERIREYLDGNYPAATPAPLPEARQEHGWAKCSALPSWLPGLYWLMFDNGAMSDQPARRDNGAWLYGKDREHANPIMFCKAVAPPPLPAPPPEGPASPVAEGEARAAIAQLLAYPFDLRSEVGNLIYDRLVSALRSQPPPTVERQAQAEGDAKDLCIDEWRRLAEGKARRVEALEAERAALVEQRNERQRLINETIEFCQENYDSPARVVSQRLLVAVTSMCAQPSPTSEVKDSSSRAQATEDQTATPTEPSAMKEPTPGSAGPVVASVGAAGEVKGKLDGETGPKQPTLCDEQLRFALQALDIASAWKTICYHLEGSGGYLVSLSAEPPTLGIGIGDDAPVDGLEESGATYGEAAVYLAAKLPCWNCGGKHGVDHRSQSPHPCPYQPAPAAEVEQTKQHTRLSRQCECLGCDRVCDCGRERTSRHDPPCPLSEPCEPKKQATGEAKGKLPNPLRAGLTLRIVGPRDHISDVWEVEVVEPTPGGHGPTEALRNELIAAARAVCARDNNAYGDLMGRFADELARQQGEKS